MVTTELPILEIHNLRKVYKKIVAVDNISLSVQPGICFGLLGPNGAGKTTTIEILEDIIEPTSGKILFKGKPRKNSFREQVGIQFQHTSLLNFLSVKETLVSFSKLFSAPEELDYLIKQCDLSSILDRKNDKLSGGQLQRLMLALALINKPSLVFLDEPSTGLDPQSRRNLWDIVDQIKNTGKTVIMTTHAMEEAEYLCDEIAIMDQGQIIAKGSPQTLIKTHCGNSFISLPKGSVNYKTTNFPFPWRLMQDKIRIESDNIPEVIKQLVKINTDLTGMSVSSANLEDVFLRLTGKQLRD